ncbi:Protein Rf1, mitochondrial [Madurella mycetomatis]|uniref:Protein Rf1, mitochondrial n=1 Tax=Madurella mycetomatis TaxID=100816 RepID=A0A175W913_9PEZI|nr:Protein Rf1, mitochondrial [Madurella mycetomatis]
MLERTAATIEPCSLQRVLPSTRTCLQSRRQLHTAFWHHGAADLELLDAVMRSPPSELKAPTIPIQSNTKPDTMTTGSAALLDFLYPGGTMALLRRPYSTHPLRLESSSMPPKPISRLFTSSAPYRSHSPVDSQVAGEESLGEYAVEPQCWELPLEEEGPERPVSREPTPAFADPGALRRLLHSDNSSSYDHIFQLYTHLEPGHKAELRTDVLLTLSSSTRSVEAWRVNDLFALYRTDEWTEQVVCAAIKAQLTLHNAAAAMSVFRAAVQQRGFGRGLDHLAAYGLEHAAWNIVLEAWELFSTIRQGTELGVDSPVVQDSRAPVRSGTSWSAEPFTSTMARDIQHTADFTEAESAESVVELTAMAGRMTEPTTTQPAGTVAESTTAKDVKPTVESSAVQDTVTVSSPAQDTKLVVESTQEQNIKPAIESVTAQFTEPAAKSESVQDAGCAAESGSEQSSRSERESVVASPTTERSTRGYPSLARVENFTAKVKQLYEAVANDRGSVAHRIGQIDTFLCHLARHSLDLFRPSDAVFILDRAKDPQAYERYIILTMEAGRKRLAGELYWKYRALPGVRVADFVLRAMIEVFHPHNVRGMEQVLGDWYRGYNCLDERAYRKFMTFYSGRGDVKSIIRLAEEHAKHHNSRVGEDPKFTVTLMNAHAVKGDSEGARRVMEGAVEKTGVPPDSVMWNVLLNAYTKAGDYEGAVKLFLRICREHEPDATTFGTIMGMAAWRGDLQYTLELFQVAKDRNVHPSVNMIRALVLAYCQNDRYAEAEKLCLDITKERKISGDYTLLWNTLLNHNAKRRDLTTVNRLLEFMSAQGVTYNQDTYSHLLLALLYCRQSHHAMHLLRVAHRERVFDPTPDHFILLMATFIKSGEPHMALRTNKLMAKLNFPESARRMTKVIDALSRWQELPSSKRHGRDGQHFLQRILKEFYKAMERVDGGSPDSAHSVVNLYSKMLFILTQMREHATVQQLIQLHNSRYPARSSPQDIPIKLLHNIMLADFFEKKFDRVKETWRIVVQRTAKRSGTAAALLNRDPEAASRPVAYAMRFRLGDPLKTMQRLHLEEGDAAGLMATVGEIRGLGFELDSKNWNYYVQALARLKEWREAFTTCESVLMPQWAGWYRVRVKMEKSKNRLPLELRRLGSNPDRPRPIAHTLIILAKEYMDLEQMRLWSHEAAREFEFITSRCPKTVRAVTTMVRSGSEFEARIFGGEERAEAKREPEDENEAYFREQLAVEELVNDEGEGAEDQQQEDENRQEWVERRGRRRMEQLTEEERQRKREERERRREVERTENREQRYAAYDNMWSHDNGFAGADESAAPPQGPTVSKESERPIKSERGPGRRESRRGNRPEGKRWTERKTEGKEREKAVRYDDIWSEGGFLNVEELAGEELETDNVANALKQRRR